jgi:hypothetical protein
MKNAWIRAVFIFGAILAVVCSALIWAARSKRLMLYQHGTPEVPQGHAFAIMNPFRDRRPEEVAEALMSDLLTSRCEQILRDLHSEDPRICPTMSGNKSARLIWRKDESMTRVIVYHLPESDSNLWITSHRDEVGFVVDGV